MKRSSFSTKQTRAQAAIQASAQVKEVVSSNLLQPLSPSDIIITRLDAIKEDASKTHSATARKVAWIAKVHDGAYGWRISEYAGIVAGVEHFDATGEAYDSLDSAEHIAACSGYTHVRVMTKTGHLTTRKVRKAFTSSDAPTKARKNTRAIAPELIKAREQQAMDFLACAAVSDLSLGQASVILGSLECV